MTEQTTRSAAVLDRLSKTIEARKSADPADSYTAKLLSRGVEKCAQKMGEEAVETVIAAVGGNKDDIIAESADLLYHLCVLWAATGVAPSDVYQALAEREGLSGLEEKKNRPKG